MKHRKEFKKKNQLNWKMIFEMFKANIFVLVKWWASWRMGRWHIVRYMKNS